MSRRLLLAIASFWLVCVITVSFIPAHEKAQLGTIDMTTAPGGHPHGTLNHRLGHMASFGLAAALLIVLAGDDYQPWRAAVSVFLLGVVLEIVEPLVFASPFEWWDIRDDGVGIALALAAFAVERRSRRKRLGNAHHWRMQE